jgi:hypothetical protein
VALAESCYDPLSEFASENPAPSSSERLASAPERSTLTDASRATVEPPFAVAHAPGAANRASGGRWVVGTVMLGVGLAAGFACAIAVVTLYGDPQTWLRMLDFGRAASDTRPVEAQPRINWSQTIEAAGPPAPPERARIERGSVELGPVIPQGSVAVLYVESRPRGAEVYLDDRLVTTTPFQLSDIALGQHTLRIEMPGYRSWSEVIDVEVGSRIAIAAALEQ